MYVWNKILKMGKKLTNEKILIREKQIHGNRYKILSPYVNARKKLDILCCECGNVFKQSIDNHLNKKCGCPVCANNVRLTVNEFIERANSIHGKVYDYSNVNYINVMTKVLITCQKHGAFEQTPMKHLNGQGCPLCGKEKTIEKKLSNSKEFIEKANLVHGNKYDYSNVEYKTSKSLIKIKCPKHGEFLQTPNKHLTGEGCPRCKQSKLESEIERLLTENKIDFIPQANKRTLPWLDKLSLDFYIPSKNIAIECQGEQHFTPVDFGGKGEEYAKEEFEKTIKRDGIKKLLCEENGVRLLYYSNIESKKNIIADKNLILEAIYL